MMLMMMMLMILMVFWITDQILVLLGMVLGFTVIKMVIVIVLVVSISMIIMIAKDNMAFWSKWKPTAIFNKACYSENYMYYFILK